MAQPIPLTPIEVAEMLRAASELLQIELGALPTQLLGWHPAAEEWCIKQVLGHLIQTEQTGFAGRIREILASEDPQLDALDQNEEVLKRDDCEKEAAELLEAFVLLRNESCKMVADLPISDLQRGGWHPDVGFMRVADLLHEWVYHDRDHIQQIMANIQAYTWDNMGATQKFYLS
jgi:hypothetical protein